MATGDHSEVFQLTRIANALEAFRDEFTTPVVDPETGVVQHGSLMERLVDVIENPMTVVNNVGEASHESDDLDPTFAALAGACYSFSDQLEAALNMPDQFKKSQELRNLVTRVRGLAEKYAENAAALDYQHAMQSRIRRVESDEAPVDLDDEPKQTIEETPDKYKPKGDWAKGGENAP